MSCALAIIYTPVFKGIELKTIWELIDCEVAAIALNTSEVWDPTPKENKEHNQILDNIIKRTLKTPRSTPREALYIETGMLDLEARRHKNRINMRKRVMEKSTESTKITMNAPVKGGWSELTDALDARYGTANKGKEAVSKLVGIGFQKKIHTDGEEKSKIKYLLEGRQKNMEVNKKAEYLEWLNRNKASAVFLTRTRMFPAKNNFRSALPSLTCRFCPHDEETQEHLLQECPGVHSDETTKVKKEDFFPQKFEYPKIWQTAANIEKVLEKIKKEEEFFSAVCTLHQALRVCKRKTLKNSGGLKLFLRPLLVNLISVKKLPSSSSITIKGSKSSFGSKKVFI